MYHITCSSLKRIRQPSIVLLVVIAVMCMASSAWACPTCKDGLAGNDPASNAMAAGYFYSILFMMSMPFLIIGML